MNFPLLEEQFRDNCRYVRIDSATPGIWRCHRHAPQNHFAGLAIGSGPVLPSSSGWATVSGNDWCGEWAATEADQ